MPKKITLTIEAECENGVSEEMLIRTLNRAINTARVTPSSNYIAVNGELIKLGYIDWVEVRKKN
jgi:hypothetical protein